MPDQSSQSPPPILLLQVLVVFGTEYGFSKEIAELLATKMKEAKKFW